MLDITNARLENVGMLDRMCADFQEYQRTRVFTTYAHYWTRWIRL